MEVNIMSGPSKWGGWGRIVPEPAADQEDNKDFRERGVSVSMGQDDTAEWAMFQTVLEGLI